LTPIKNIAQVNVIKINNSFLVASEKINHKLKLIVPKNNRVYNQKEYTALRIIPKPANNATNGFFTKIPTKIKNSPIKFEVVGNPILPIRKRKKKTLKSGITVTRPP
jgi:hypothetical protein